MDFSDEVMSQLFNMLSRLVITFLPRSKYLLISWLQSPSAVILEPPIIKCDTVSTVSPSISHDVDHNKLWKILKKMGIPAHLTCLFFFFFDLPLEKAICRSGGKS